ncbi:hypothetical protein GJAV_G00052870 [Gymnothorax javanicus]|nr:hypothetical protein GJAV_G00052870 [Gymnothorax javanicus]
MNNFIPQLFPIRLKRFAVNFKCGDLKCSDIALHFNPRFCPCEVVVLNIYRQGWKREERVKKMPFTKGADFEMLIVVTPTGYQVHVNGQVFYMFRHRMPVEHVTNIQVVGGIFVRNVDIIGGVQRGVTGLGQEELVVNSIPFVGPITGGLSPGACLVFQGTVHDTIDRFHINLRCGQIRCSDIALHFNPRFKHCEVVVMNIYRHGWKREERVQKMPFTKGGSFELVFVITPEGYQVLVNGSFFYLFKHRIPVQRVRAIEIGGAVSIQSVNIIRMSTPYKQPISCTLKPGMLLTFQGTVPHRADRFSINLLCGEQEGCDNAFHFNPRFVGNVLVLNTFQNGGWQTEQRPGKMPFARGASFELVIAVTAEGYQIIVNGDIIDMFAHRIPVERVTSLAIYKDVSIYDIDIAEGEPGGIPICPGGLEGMIIPHVRPITVRPGMSLLFQGMIPTEKCRFAINFRCGETNIALHFNPRFDSEVVVVFNSFDGSGWQNEERPSKMPFRLGESFELFILVKAQGYQIIVNGCKFHFFKHRIPLDQVTTLEITKDVILHNIEITEAATGGIAICPGVPEPPTLPEVVVVGKIPYVRPLSGSFKPGMSVYFQGIIPLKPRRFSLNFKCGESDIALHFNPRFCPCEVVVLNSYQGGWKNEERVQEMLFNKGGSFEMVIFITTQGYKVTINSCVFYTFNHRIDVGQVTSLEVRGDVAVETLDIIEGLGEGVVICPGEEVLDELPEEEPEEEEEEQVISRVPLLRPVHEGLKVGMILIFQGIVPQEIDGFAINLKCGEKPGSDIALHFNPRFTEGVVVLNSCKNGGWGQEERPPGMPFSKGEKFVLVIIITPDGYQLNINSVDFHVFKHRIAMEEVRALEMDEDFTANIILAEQEAAEPEEDETVVVPFVQTFESSLNPGMALYFNGSVPADLTGFSINLCCGENDIKMENDIPLHFNPRLETSVVVFNSSVNGGWQNEERPTEMPFARGEDFEVLFVITVEGYKVFVNGCFFHLFNHRIPLENVKSLLIKDNVFIRTFDIIQEYVPEVPEEEEQEEEEEEVVSVPQYEQPIDGVLKAGTSLYFQGSIPDELDCFVINLPTKDSDIALSFTARLDTCMLLFNSCQGGQWQQEEKVEVMPFLEGEYFELVFIITTVGYKIVINSEEVYTFNHRIGLELVCAVRIDGDVSIQTVNTIETAEQEEFVEPDIDDWLTISPYVQSTPGNLKIGQTVYFQGSLPEEISSFSISLQYGHTETCDVALRFSAQFEPAEAVIFNHRKDEIWGTEEKLDGTPFHKGEHFEIVICITAEHCQVTVNGTVLHTFNYRISIEDVCAVRLDGNVSMETITVLETQQVTVPGGDDSTITISPGDVTFIEECYQVSSYLEPIPSLRPETTLYFQGAIPEEIDGFSIDLMCGESADSNIAFHFNPLFKSSEVVFNSFYDNAWGQEERVPMKHFAKGQNFELLICIAANHFQVELGGEEFHKFQYRMDVAQVCAVKITGNVQMQTLNITEQAVQVEIEGTMETQVEMITGEPIYNPAVPYTGVIESGMTVKKTIIITGSVTAEANSFSCSFMTGSGDIAFLLNPRITEAVVVRNSCLGGSWGEEERDSDYNPFERDAQFEMLIRCGNNKFSVFVNGQLLCYFTHRHQPVTDINKVEIAGDVQLSYIIL